MGEKVSARYQQRLIWETSEKEQVAIFRGYCTYYASRVSFPIITGNGAWKNTAEKADKRLFKELLLNY